MSSSRHNMHGGDLPTIAEWYKGRNILVTGATGFMGKVLLEKMLHSIPDIGNIYILTRSKNGLVPSSRVDEMTKLPLFQQLRDSNPQVLKKIVAIEGDVTMENLGMNDSNIKLLHAEVSVVFHLAATVKLSPPLKDAVKQNLIGTQQIIQFCKGMKKLEAFVHSSTTYCHSEIPVVEEKVYAPTRNPKDIINLVRWMDDKSLEQITPSIIEPHPNTYTFTKRLAETVVAEAAEELPILIARPSLVLPTIKEPMPGWVDTLTGPIGGIILIGTGVARSMLVDKEKVPEVIPVDIASNGMIIAAWIRGTRSFPDVPVHNVTQVHKIRITWGEVFEKGQKQFLNYPFEKTLWYPCGDIRTNKLVHNIIVFLFQVVPAYFLDLLLMLAMKKRCMVRMQKRIMQTVQVQHYFLLRNWNIINKAFLSANEELCEHDRETFYTTNIEVNIDEYLKHITLGTRLYCLKEDPKTLPRARKYVKFLYVIDRVCKCFFLFGIFWIVLQISQFA